MRRTSQTWVLTLIIFVGIGWVQPLAAEEDSVKQDPDSKRTARLDFMRGAIEKIVVKPIDLDDVRDLTFKPQPLLRYSDPARGIADSAVWRLGERGRPIAIVTSEVYGPMQNKRFQMNHEFLAIDHPRLTMECARYVWQPPADTSLSFQAIPSADAPAEKPPLRLKQMKQLAEKFTLREFFEGNNIELRLLPTPIDRYQPSDSPNADGAIFAGVWGVNPEVLLFIETDGKAWSYAFTRSGSAKLWAILDDREVWSVPATDLTRNKPYSLIVNPVKVPVTTFED